MGEIEPAFGPPIPITPQHRLGGFDCGKQPLNDFLQKRALGNEGKASRTYVVTVASGDLAGEVVAYYTLAAGAVRLEESPKKLTRNMPNPLPVMILGRLAVDVRFEGRGLGKAMLREAMQRVLRASQSIGARALVVHAIDDEAAAFYARFGLQPFPPGSRTLWLPTETIAAAL